MELTDGYLTRSNPYLTDDVWIKDKEHLRIGDFVETEHEHKAVLRGNSLTTTRGRIVSIFNFVRNDSSKEIALGIRSV
jgi:hypothetical protein